MARLGNAELLRRNAELEAETLDGGSRKKRSWAWAVLTTVLITIGALMAPFAVVAAWANAHLTDTDRFVAAFAPLAQEPRIQDFITSETIVVINEQVDIPELTSSAIDGITSLGTGPAATRALELLKGPAASGIQSLMQTSVSRFVASDAFANVWTSALRVSHTQLIATMQNDANAAVAIGRDGFIGIQLGPIVEAVKAALIEQGIEFARQIPAVDRTIVVAQSDALPSLQLGYALAVSLGAWLPWFALVFLVAGVLVTRRRSVALIWTAIALALSMVATVVVLGVGSLLFMNAVSPSLLPSGVAGLLYETVVGDMRTTAVAVLVLAVVLTVVAWLAGRFRPKVQEPAG